MLGIIELCWGDSIAVAGASVGVLSAVLALLVVPSLLALLGTRIDALSIRRGPAVSDESDGWYRLARGVMRHPVGIALASAGLLLAAASPLLWTTLTGPSAEAVPTGAPSYEAYKYLDARYPRRRNRGSHRDRRRADDQRAAGELRPSRRGTGRHRARHTTGARLQPGRLRQLRPAGPGALRGLPGHGQGDPRARPSGQRDAARFGNTARFIDQKQSLLDHLPLVVGLIAATTLIILFLLTGSVLLPLKTLLMNAMTLGATLGIVVLAFQDGLLDGLFAYTGRSAVEVTSLVFLFAVIFGLATDYAVLVISRIKEQHDLGAGNEEAVAIGIGRTGRVITAAAVCIAVVFLAFGVSSVFFMKQIAVGMAVGVMLDATIVRALLVPSLMRLLGEWNWWAPAPLRRIYLRFRISEA